MTRDWAVMVEVHVKLSVDGISDIRMIEVREDVGKDYSAVCFPGVPGIRFSEAFEYNSGIEVELLGWEWRIAVHNEVVCFQFRTN